MKTLNWRPSVTFEEGIGRTIDWYLANAKWLKNIVSGKYQKYYETMYSGR
jgi:dTDP-glucose 4,6-dehydratase